MPSPTDTRRPRRYLAIAEDLLAAIQSGRYTHGARLPAHSEIAAAYRVSRPIAREAFLALELAGAVEVRHGDGTFVSERAVHTPRASALEAPPHELIESRFTIEPICAGLAAERISFEQADALDKLLDLQELLIDDPDALATFVELGLQFHADLAPACGNGLLADIAQQLVNSEKHPLWSLVNQQGLPDRCSRRRQIREHRAILSAVRSGDATAASTAMRTHLGALTHSLFGRGSA